MVHHERIHAQDGDAGTLHLSVVPWHTSRALKDIAGWEKLAQSTSTPNPFFEHWALLPALENFDPEQTVAICSLYNGSELVGLMPLLHQRNYYGRSIKHLTTWLHPNAFCGAPLVAQGYEIAFWAQLLEWSDRCPGSSLYLHLPSMPADTAVHSALLELLGQDARSATVVKSEERAMLASSLSPQTYFEAALSNKRRKELRRQSRRLAELGEVKYERDCSNTDVSSWVEAFLQLEKAGWKGANRTALATDKATAAFFRDAISGAAAAGRLERLTLTLDGKPIAMLATFLTAPGAFSFKTTYDEAYAHLSPGVLLQQENLGMLEREDIDWCDSCATADHPMIDRMWTERRTVKSLNVAIGRKMRRTAMKCLAKLETGSFPKGLT